MSIQNEANWLVAMLSKELWLVQIQNSKQTWIERCRHLCVCPLIDHRREPIRMRELLGLIYNMHMVHHLLVLVIMSTTSVFMSVSYGLPSTIVMSLVVIATTLSGSLFFPSHTKKRDLGNEIEPSLYWPQTIYLRSNIARGENGLLPYKPHQMWYQETNKAHESLKDEEKKKKI